MAHLELTPYQWDRILTFLRGRSDLYIGREDRCRRFVTAVLWITRSGAQWRLLLEAYGNWNSVFKRFALWCDRGIWDELHQHLADDPDTGYLIIDSTVARAHPDAAGAPKKRADRRPRPWGAAAAGSAPKSTSSWTVWAILCASS